jgi:hypothetical protein
MRQATITPQFVEFIPDRLQEGVLYISEKYGTVVHKCCCGCGEEVVTPLTPADWQLRKEGSNVTLFPSIGNWNFPCQSHYWIRKNRVEWARAMTKQQIRRVQERDRQDKEHYVAQVNARKADGAVGRPEAEQTVGKAIGGSGLHGLWLWLKDWLSR